MDDDDNSDNVNDGKSSTWVFIFLCALAINQISLGNTVFLGI